MNILILNGSPKGSYSITLQTARYLMQRYPAHSFETLHVGQRIRALEGDMAPAVAAIGRADLLLFVYPVYTFLAPAQLHRFFELLKAAGVSFAGKFATQITTSKHFYDVTAHRYVEQNVQDLGAKYVRGLSADMDDLLTDRGRADADAFFAYVCHCMEPDSFEPLPKPAESSAHAPVGAPPACAAEKPGDVVIVTDCEPENAQLAAMIARFSAVLPRKTRIVNLRDFPFQGGCLGCFHCAVTGQCVYRDGFDEFLRTNIQRAEAVVCAFTVRDHSMGALFKRYDDRQFCNGHRTVTAGMPVGYLVSGAYSAEPNLQTVLEARAQVGGNFLSGVASDETDPDGEISRLADTLSYAIEHRYAPPRNFYGVGGMKIFRDLIWGMQGMMKADHRYYRAHHLYDFPQKKPFAMLKMYLVGALLSSPQIQKKIGNRMNEGMIAPYQKVLDRFGAPELS